MTCEILLQVQSASGANPLRDAWVYWREGGTTTLLRSSTEGLLQQPQQGADPSQPWTYSQRFMATPGAQVELFYSRGARPLPTARLDEHPGAFVARTVELPAPDASQPTVVDVAPGELNTLEATPRAVVLLPEQRVQLTQPVELTLWPLLWEPVADTYYTNGLSQGAALWGASGLTVTEQAAATAPSAQARPRERGLRVAGQIDSRVTAVRLQVLDAAGNAVPLRQEAGSTADVSSITGTLGATTGNLRNFEAALYFSRTVEALGSVQLLVQGAGTTPLTLGSFACQLVGVQIALVADDAQDGRTRGAVLTEADERIIVDFRDSPRETRDQISAQTRARRMVTYDIPSRDRPLSETNDAQVLKPEMPLWMAELHLVGADRAALEDLLLRRRQLPGGANVTGIQFGLQWTLRLSWDGPDSGTTSPRRYSYNQSFTQQQTIQLTLGEDGRLQGVDAQGAVAGAMSPAPAVIPFPIENRRLPGVFVSQQTRAWGRVSGAATRGALLMEWQPSITANGVEIIRGGDGRLSLDSLSIDGTRVDAGRRAGGATTPVPDAQLPDFRVQGVNIASPANDLIDALVQDYYDTHSTLARITLLPVACWQETIRLILAHEAGFQFEHRGAGRRRYGGMYYGHEQLMPIFGPPHGYGYGQLDNPRVTDDQAWSFLENLKEAIRRVMEDKATPAYTLVSPHLTDPATRREQAVYRREIVRRYNGGREFRWNATDSDWEIHPSVDQWADANDHTSGANPRLTYPNDVLGTSIVYSTGAGAQTQFPWPIAFTEANYGPGL